MAAPGEFEVVRDPVWNNIRIDKTALAVVDTEPFQRLRYIRQLGHAFLVYPGATHTRFEHALGAYGLARRTLDLLEHRGQLSDIPVVEPDLVRFAALLHDIGHYPFSHALEEAGLPSHETLAVKHLRDENLLRILSQTGIPNIETRLVELITGTSRSPLAGLISGSLDLDKLEYLTRDAHMCGVPYGTVDVDRLIHSITIVETQSGQQTVGFHEKGMSALESLLFAKYQMYRNVYWHHAVRSATALFKRLVRTVIARTELDTEWIANATDEALMERMRQLSNRSAVDRLRGRRLYKRIMDSPAADLAPGSGDWIAENPDLVERVENRLAEEHGLEPGELLLDFPKKPNMLAVNIYVQTAGRGVELISDSRPSGQIGIHEVRHELHTSARRLRVFAAHPIAIDENVVLSLAEQRPSDIVQSLEAERITR